MKTTEEKKAMFENIAEMQKQYLISALEIAFIIEVKQKYSYNDDDLVEQCRAAVLKAFLKVAQNIF